MTYKVSKYTKSGLNFNYKYIPIYFEEEQVSKRSISLINQFGKITKRWSNELNSEWMLRNYLAIKMILSSTVLLSSLKYANSKNFKIVEPYLTYYSLLTSCRALVYTLPNIEWGNGELMKLSHNTIINTSVDSIYAINKDVGEEFKYEIYRAKDYRELFSYCFPAKGLNFKNVFPYSSDHVIHRCATLCELAQFNSEILSYSIDKNIKIKYEYIDEILYKGFEHETSQDFFVDADDSHQLFKMIKTMDRPTDLHSSMSEGLVDDYFSSWETPADSDGDRIFSPHNWRMIYSVR